MTTDGDVVITYASNNLIATRDGTSIAILDAVPDEGMRSCIVFGFPPRDGSEIDLCRPGGHDERAIRYALNRETAKGITKFALSVGAQTNWAPRWALFRDVFGMLMCDNVIAYGYTVMRPLFPELCVDFDGRANRKRLRTKFGGATDKSAIEVSLPIYRNDGAFAFRLVPVTHGRNIPQGSKLETHQRHMKEAMQGGPQWKERP